jgi:hypothetical protein
MMVGDWLRRLTVACALLLGFGLIRLPEPPRQGLVAANANHLAVWCRQTNFGRIAPIPFESGATTRAPVLRKSLYANGDDSSPIAVSLRVNTTPTPRLWETR